MGQIDIQEQLENRRIDAVIGMEKMIQSLEKLPAHDNTEKDALLATYRKKQGQLNKAFCLLSVAVFDGSDVEITFQNSGWNHDAVKIAVDWLEKGIENRNEVF